MRKIEFYTSGSGRCPTRDFLDSLPPHEARRVWCVLDALRTLERVPADYQRPLRDAPDLWEARVREGARAFRLLGCTERGRLMVLVSGLAGKRQGEDAAAHDVALAQRRRRDDRERRRRQG